MIATWKPVWRNRAAARRTACLAFILMAPWVISACHRAPAEQQIRQAIYAAATAARTNDAAGVLAVVDDDFTGNGGDLDKRGLRRLLAVRAFRQDKTGVLIGPVSFEHKGNRVIAKFNLVLTGGRPGDLLPDQSVIYAMATAWRREGGHWRCYSAEWSNSMP